MPARRKPEPMPPPPLAPPAVPSASAVIDLLAYCERPADLVATFALHWRHSDLDSFSRALVCHCILKGIDLQREGGEEEA
jgi:hypothetical protein